MTIASCCPGFIRLAVALAGLLLAGALAGAGQQQEVAGPNLKVIELSIGAQQLTAEVADTEPARRHGLMFRESLPEDHGMLFIWDKPARYAMWMQNTPLPLSVAFIDAEGRIVNIEHMQPHTTATHQAMAPVIYALEMEQGWFAARGIRSGDRVSGLPD